jgi:iron(III) transport system permease protein
LVVARLPKGSGFWLALAAVVVLGILPLALVIAEGVRSGDVFTETLTAPETLDALGGTLRLSLGTTVLALLIGAPLAWLTTRTDLPWAGFFRSVLTIPYIIPPYIAAVAWITLANPRVGVLNTLLGAGTLDIYSMGGLTWVMALSFYPYVFLTVRGALLSADPSLEDAARMSGAGTWRVLVDIALPLMRPALVASGSLVFMVTASAFGAPALIGNAARLDFLSTSIFDSLTSGLGGMAQASSMACVLLALALLPMLLRARHHAVLTGKATRPTRIRLGRARWPAHAALLLFVLVAVFVPALAVAVTAFLRVAGDLSIDNFTLANFDVLSRSESGGAILASLWLAVGAATAAVALGGFVAFLQVKTRRRGRHLLSALTALPLAAPGTVLALGLILVWTTPLKLVNTVWILLIAYLAKYAALAARAIGEGLGAIDDALPEAARMSGARGLLRLRTIWIPLAMPALVAGWFLVFMPAFSELTMSVLLVGPGIETVGTRLFELREYESPTAASVLATVVLALVVTSNLLLRWLSRGRYGV